MRKLTLLLLISFVGFLFIAPTPAEATDYFVSRQGDNSQGTSWQTAWNELDQIAWDKIQPGDTIFLDGGDTSMGYRTTLAPTRRGRSDNPITIKLSTEPGRNGQAVFHGGRQARLPECGQSSLTPYPSEQDINQNKFGVYFDNVSNIILDGSKWEGILILRNETGVRFNSNTHHITLRNLEIVDNGRVFQDNDGSKAGLWYSDGPGIVVQGHHHLFERLSIHDNGQDSIQSGNTDGTNNNLLDNLTIRLSWLRNERQHSGKDNSPSGDSPDELGAPNQGPKYNGYNESFNWCRHSDALQVFAGEEVRRVAIQDSVLGPGFTNTLMLGETNPKAFLTYFTMQDVLVVKGADNNINSKANTINDEWDLRNITVDSSNTKYNSVRLFGTNHAIRDSVFIRGNGYFEQPLLTTSGNCLVNPRGDVFGRSLESLLFTHINTTNPFSNDNYAIAAGTTCAKKGSRLTSVQMLLNEVGAK